MKNIIKLFLIIFTIAYIIILILSKYSSLGIFPNKCNHNISINDINTFNKILKSYKDSYNIFNHSFYDKLSSNNNNNELSIMNTQIEYISYLPTININNKNLKLLIDNTLNYAVKTMKAKVKISSNNLNNKDFVVTYNTIGYNAAASEALYRISLTNTTNSREDTFIADKISYKIIKDNFCHNDNTINWYISYASLKLSFDVRYLQILFGKSYFTDKELFKIIHEMKNIIDALYICTPPQQLTLITNSEYKSIIKSYIKMKELAEYTFISTFQENNYVLSLINQIYSTKQLSNILSSTDNDAFRTLGILSLVELHSKSNL